MGWQARLPKDQKPCFERTCNKCGGTGYKKTFIAMDGHPIEDPIKIKCRCTIQAEEAAKEAAKNASVVE